MWLPIIMTIVGVVLLAIGCVVRYRFLGLVRPEVFEFANIPLFRRLYLWAWVVALLVSGCLMITSHGLLAVFFFPCFPVGLMYGIDPLIPKRLNIILAQGVLPLFLFAGTYVFYLVHGFIVFRTTSKDRFAVLYGILLVALALNVYGCIGVGGVHPN